MRNEEFWIDVLDQFGTLTGQFQPELGGKIQATSTNMIVRSLTGLFLGPTDTLVRGQLIRPMISINGGVGQSLGVFRPTLGARHQTDLGVLTEVNGHDLGYRILKGMHTAFGVNAGDSIAAAIVFLMARIGINVSIVDRGDIAGTYLAWPPGSPNSDALDALMRLVSLVARMDRSGTLNARNLPYIGVDVPVKSWQAGEASELAPDAVEVFDEYDTPNLWWVMSVTGTTVLAGKYELADDHPDSFMSTREHNATTMQVTGLTTTAECEQRARDEAQRDPSVHDTVELSCDIDPTLEPLDVVTYKSGGWLIDSFGIEMKPGAQMHVRLRSSLVV